MWGKAGRSRKDRLVAYNGIFVIYIVAFCNGIYKQKFCGGLLKALIASAVDIRVSGTWA